MTLLLLRPGSKLHIFHVPRSAQTCHTGQPNLVLPQTPHRKGLLGEGQFFCYSVSLPLGFLVCVVVGCCFFLQKRLENNVSTDTLPNCTEQFWMSVTSIPNCSGFALPAGIDPKNSHCTQVISVLQLQVLITTFWNFPLFWMAAYICLVLVWPNSLENCSWLLVVNY